MLGGTVDRLGVLGGRHGRLRCAVRGGRRDGQADLRAAARTARPGGIRAGHPRRSAGTRPARHRARTQGGRLTARGTRPQLTGVRPRGTGMGPRGVPVGTPPGDGRGPRRLPPADAAARDRRLHRPRGRARLDQGPAGRRRPRPRRTGRRHPHRAGRHRQDRHRRTVRARTAGAVPGRSPVRRSGRSVRRNGPHALRGARPTPGGPQGRHRPRRRGTAAGPVPGLHGRPTHDRRTGQRTGRRAGAPPAARLARLPRPGEQPAPPRPARGRTRRAPLHPATAVDRGLRPAAAPRRRAEPVGRPGGGRPGRRGGHRRHPARGVHHRRRTRRPGTPLLGPGGARTLRPDPRHAADRSPHG